jgi:hypothetical protein
MVFAGRRLTWQHWSRVSWGGPRPSGARGDGGCKVAAHEGDGVLRSEVDHVQAHGHGRGATYSPRAASGTPLRRQPSIVKCGDVWVGWWAWGACGWFVSYGACGRASIARNCAIFGATPAAQAARVGKLCDHVRVRVRVFAGQVWRGVCYYVSRGQDEEVRGPVQPLACRKWLFLGKPHCSASNGSMRGSRPGTPCACAIAPLHHCAMAVLTARCDYKTWPPLSLLLLATAPATHCSLFLVWPCQSCSIPSRSHQPT